MTGGTGNRAWERIWVGGAGTIRALRTNQGEAPPSRAPSKGGERTGFGSVLTELLGF